MAIYGSLGDIDVGAISKSISDTAADIFVYDTRKDSDGGAWRKRTQHTSWYNETLNTPTRGSRRDFPAMAVIVATSTSVTIYDGDDPDMPMWMVFNGTTTWNQGLYYSGNGSRCIFALNGIISWGDGAGAFGLITVSFINEFCTSRTSNTSYGGFSNVPLSNRNSTTAATFSANTYSHTAGVLAGVNINDVAMTVLSNAPINPSTGLPVPSIAVATINGVSVIIDDGTIESTDVANIVRLGFVKNDRLAYGHRAGYAYQGISLDIAPFRNSATYGWYINQTTPSFGGYTITDSAGSVQGLGDGNVYAWGGSTGGIRRISENISSPTNGMVNYITTSYNTGWMHGDIKGTWLSDTSTTSVTGSELVINGTFATDVGSWTAANSATVTLSSNRIRVTAGAPTNGLAYQQITTVVGQWYVISYDAFPQTANTTFGQLYIRDGSITGTILISSNNSTQTTYTHTFQATSTATFIVLYGSSTNTNGNYAEWDNISLRIAELDRSINNKGLQVFGTITKTPVATGADLVSYSGFSSSNYLQQPYNSSLDFGTGDFCIMTWLNTSAAGNIYAISRGIPGVASNPRWGINGSTTQAIGFNISGSIVLNTEIFTNGTWQFVCFTRSSGNISSYVNGNFINSTINTTNLTNTSASLIIGNWVNGAYYYGGKLSLLRISTTIPSPEQIKKIYEDEKELFMENSKATLFGTSNAVTALAYDDTTKLLHVGTSSGRSDFQGLRRINNTTTAVTTAISASNGLIAEQ
jgi:hypothetical protein